MLNEIRITDIEDIRIAQTENKKAGTGCTVGKISGMNTCMKTGIESFAVRTSGGLKAGAVVALNALGDVFDYKTSEQIAGLR